MPRISKIRLTGCKYDGMRKEHEDSIFDLTKDGVPDHTLFTLCNGGGKGVMMQLIFQLLLPTTRWGKNDGNKIISMFYDQRNNLHPYTFHVVLEWVLDTIPEKRLITGIAIKAIMKNTTMDEEEKTGLSYYLYTYEHDNNGYYTVENLPLYDKKIGEAVDINVFDNFLNDNKRDFIKYSQSSVRRKDGEYYRYLESRGIHRAEWLNLKTMNKSEGGVGDYFIGASDNKSIFDKVIIPAISENLRNYTMDDGDNLIQMFKSNLSITKDLPVLIKREGDYKELLVEIEPLIQNADSGSRFINLKDRLIDEGNDIYYILKDEDSIIRENIDKWTREEEKARQERRELKFKKDNLHYNMGKRELEAKGKEVENLNNIFNEKSLVIEEKREELLTYEINEILCHKKETEEKVHIKTIERERLVEALDISDIKGRVDELDDKIDIEWNRTKKLWHNKEEDYNGYLNYIKGRKEESLSRIRKYKDKKAVLEKEINKFELREENLEEKKGKLQEYYDPMTLMFPERILEDLAKSKEKAEGLIDSLIEQEKIFKENVLNINNELNKIGYALRDKEDSKKNLEEEVSNKEKYELELAKRVSKQLLENYDGSFLNHNWFKNKLSSLEGLEDRKRRSLEEIQRIIWEKNIEKSLNKEDYFIPNKDIVLVKEEIGSIGIHVETGAEYLKGLDKKEREDILEKYPEFLYSVVIGNDRDWELIDKNISKDIFLNNMVPVYIRSEMESRDNRFNLILSKAYELVEDEAYEIWRSNLEKEFESLIQNENALRDDLKNIEEIKGELVFISKGDTAHTLTQKLREIEKEILEINDKIRVQEEERLDYENKLYIVEKALGKNNQELATINTSIIEIGLYIKMIKEIEEDRKRILEINESLNGINTKISNLEYENETMEENKNSINNSYNKWAIRIQNILEDIKSIYKDKEYKSKTYNDYLNHNIPDFTTGADILQILLKERKILEEDIKVKDKEISNIDIELKYLYRDLNRHIEDLEKLHKSWNDYLKLEISLNEILIKKDETKKEVKRLEKEGGEIKSILDITLGSIREMRKGFEAKEKQIQREHKRPPIIVEIEDIQSEINMVERDIDSNKTYLGLCIEEIEKNNRIGSKLQINLSKIRHGYGLEPAKGKMDKILKGKIQNNPDLIVDDWINRTINNEREINKTVDEGERYRSLFIKKANNRLEEDRLKERIVSSVKEANINNFKNNIISFKSMKNHFQQEILALSNDKVKAEGAMKQWTDRASIYVINMIDSLKNMVNSMNYSNEQGYVFPLVKLKGIERLPKEESEVAYLLEEYFIEAISKVLEKNEDIDKIEDRVLNDVMGDKAIFSKALQGRYPTLLVYKMSEKNEFKFARARDEYYTTWEAINKGEGDLPEGSGGQTLSVNTFVIMMIMSFKKKHIGNENPSTVLILDNPFGKASAKHVLDPIFEIANKLNFQLITFAAPEIIKMEISERFPVFWELKIGDGKVIHGGRIIKQNP